MEHMGNDVDAQAVRIGRRIREERKQRGLTLKQLADPTGLSVPYLSQIENGHVNLNITVLENISKTLGITMIALFVNGNEHEVSLVRRSERRWLDLGGWATESLLVKVRSNLEIFSIRLPPAQGSQPMRDSSHEGEEFTFVIKGAVRITLDNRDVYELNEGDILYYPSMLPHRWENNGPVEAEILVVNTPATY